jgi:anti-anti-sigma factor
MGTQMEIVRRPQGEDLELVVEGRLDGYWSQHLATAVDEALREGTHHLRLNLSGVSYISSAGIRVLLSAHLQFAAIEGSMRVVEPSAAVRQVLELAGLAALLAGEGLPQAETPAPSEGRPIPGTGFEVYAGAGEGGLDCEVLGFPELLDGAAFTAKHCHSLSVGEDAMALGIGAFGDGFNACQDRFGEFVGVAGGVACQPTDGTNFPDYVMASGTLVPRVTALYALRCQGEFGRLLRFESKAAHGPLPLSKIVETCLDAAGVEAAGIVMLAESAGLLGASLKRSPARPAEGGGSVFAVPEIRQWLSFSPQRTHARTVALVAGLAARKRTLALRSLLRPLGNGSQAFAHLHAAAFGYRPMQKGRIELKTAVRSLFDGGGLQGVLHLLADDREIAGGGESEFLRGACWVAPLKQIVVREVPA